MRTIFTYPKAYKKGGTKIAKYLQPMISTVSCLFSVRLFVDDYYLLYTTPGISAPLAEMCKPVIYVYDDPSKEISNSKDASWRNFYKFILTSIPIMIHGFSLWIKQDRLSLREILKHLLTSTIQLIFLAMLNLTHGVGPSLVKRCRNFWRKTHKSWTQQKRKEDFIEYWKNEFEDNTLYFISFKFNKEIKKYIQLSFSENRKRCYESSWRLILLISSSENKLCMAWSRKQIWSWSSHKFWNEQENLMS